MFGYTSVGVGSSIVQYALIASEITLHHLLCVGQD
jgi:hypothetical protein